MKHWSTAGCFISKIKFCFNIHIHIHIYNIRIQNPGSSSLWTRKTWCTGPNNMLRQPKYTGNRIWFQLYISHGVAHFVRGFQISRNSIADCLQSLGSRRWETDITKYRLRTYQSLEWRQLLVNKGHKWGANWWTPSSSCPSGTRMVFRKFCSPFLVLLVPRYR